MTIRASASTATATALWLLGASDPEMAAIESLLAARGQEFAYAAAPGRDGVLARVAPGSAYRAALYALAPGGGEVELDGRTVALVECDLAPELVAAAPITVIVRCDHHREWDAGFGRPPAEYWPASSLGQVARALGLSATFYPAREGEGLCLWQGHGWGVIGWGDRDPGSHPLLDAALPAAEALLVAAGDHCPGAAYRGECPGVDPEALMAWRAESRAAFQGRPVEAVLADVEAARAVIRATGAWFGPADLTRLPGGTVPELPEAALREGAATLALVSLPGGAGRKIVLGGAAPNQADIVTEFLAEVANGHVLGWAVDPASAYGDPARGYAGATLAD